MGFWAKHMGMTKLGVRSSLLMSRIARAIKKIQEKKLRKGDLGPWLLVGFNDFNKDGKWWERAGKSPGFTKATPQAISTSITPGLKQARLAR